MNGLTKNIKRVLGSPKFYWAVIVFFVLEAIWIAFSANYPMAFDEEFHFGVIKIYSEQWLPFLSGQPEGAGQFGALATDPSYLYYYFMSFPYRVIATFTDIQQAQVMLLRLINIAIIAAAVVLFRKVLLGAGISRAMVSVATLLFALIPTVPLLAGQINYDNLLLLAVAWVCWLILKITQDLKQGHVNLKTYALLAIVLMLTCLVKYAFLPIAVAAAIYIVLMWWRSFRGNGKTLALAVTKSYATLSIFLKFSLLGVLIVCAGLFVQRFGLNLVNYGQLVPNCAEVIGAEACMENGPWARDYNYALGKSQVDSSPVRYTWHWLEDLHFRLFFMVNGPPEYVNYPPSPLPAKAGIVIAALSLTCLIFYRRRVFSSRPFLWFLLLAAVLYLIALWVDNYTSYLDTGQRGGINGRYLIPLLLPLAALFGRSLSIAFKDLPNVKTWLALTAIVLFLQGGGVFGFILRSDESWYWPNETVIEVNQSAQNLLDPVIIEGSKTY